MQPEEPHRLNITPPKPSHTHTHISEVTHCKAANTASAQKKTKKTPEWRRLLLPHLCACIFCTFNRHLEPKTPNRSVLHFFFLMLFALRSLFFHPLRRLPAFVAAALCRSPRILDVPFHPPSPLPPSAPRRPHSSPLPYRSHNSAVTWQRAPSWTQHQPRCHGNWRHDTDVVNMSGLLKWGKEREKEWEGKSAEGGGVGNAEPRMHSVLQRPMRRRRARQAALRGWTGVHLQPPSNFHSEKDKDVLIKTHCASSTVVFFHLFNPRESLPASLRFI